MFTVQIRTNFKDHINATIFNCWTVTSNKCSTCRAKILHHCRLTNIVETQRILSSPTYKRARYIRMYNVQGCTWKKRFVTVVVFVIYVYYRIFSFRNIIVQTSGIKRYNDVLSTWKKCLAWSTNILH